MTKTIKVTEFGKQCLIDFDFLTLQLISMFFIVQGTVADRSAKHNADIKTPLIYLRRQIPEQLEECNT